MFSNPSVNNSVHRGVSTAIHCGINTTPQTQATHQDTVTTAEGMHQIEYIIVMYL